MNGPSKPHILQVHDGGADRMLREVQSELKRRRNARFAFAVFMFSSGEDPLMFYFTNAGRLEILRRMKEFIATQDGEI